ncbi:MAG: general secretion pathway protein GspK [Kiloniellaceae bacterium]
MSARAPGARRRGLALVSVLWVLTLLSLIAASFMLSTRTEINLARNQGENARAEALADAGVYTALVGVMNDDPDLAWRVDGTVYGWRFGAGELRVSVDDEGGKVDINVASEVLLRDLFVAAGLEEGEARSLADAVVDFRDPNDLTRANGAEDPAYRRAGLPYGAKDAPFETLEELRQVLGMTPAIFERVRPGLTVHGRQRQPHAATAPPLVRAALAGEVLNDTPPDAAPADDGIPPIADDADAADAAGVTEVPTPLGPVDSEAPQRSRARAVFIHAEARTDSGAVFARDAVVRVETGEDLPFEVREWMQGRRRLFADAAPSAAPAQ